MPNNATIEMEKMSEDELERQSQQEVSVCVQLPGGERLMDSFPTSTSLGSVLDTMGEKLVYFHDRAVEYHEKRMDGRSLTKRQKRTLNAQAVSALKWTFQVILFS